VSAAWRDLDVFLVMAGDPRRPGSEAVVDDRQIAIMAILTTGSEAPPARIQSLDPDLGSALRIRTWAGGGPVVLSGPRPQDGV